MSVSINSNYAASAASNNLVLSNSMLQRSLNRLSSGSRLVNPNDDAGGLAVSMRLSATAKRSGSAATNLNNAVSLLQNQDGALKVGGKILERMAELQSLWNDATKNAEDKSLYDIEFNALQGQLRSLSEEKFNGVNIFGSTATHIITSAAGDQTLTIAAKGVGATGTEGTPSKVTSSAYTTATVAGTVTIAGITIAVTTADTATSMMEKIRDNADLLGKATASLDSSGKLVISNAIYGANDLVISGTAAALTALGISAATTNNGTADTRDKVSVLMEAASLGDTFVDGVDLDVNEVINDAQNEFASYRAHNGAEQNGLNFAAELLVLNKANLEAATGRIVDVDVADESTQLAKWTTLTQAGTAMLAQANQANSLVLKLIGG